MANFGDTLKRERELREISLREISDATKINIRYLEALEQNRFDSLPGGLFNKGFIRAYSTYIGVDGEAMVNRYLQELASRQGAGSGATGEVPPGVHRPAESPRRRAGPNEDSGSNGRSLKITFAPPQPEGVGSQGAHTPSPGLPKAPVLIDREPVVPIEGRSHDFPPRIVTHIEETGSPDTHSRVLPAILAFVAAAALLFVGLALIFGRPSHRGSSVPAVALGAGLGAAPTAGADPLAEEARSEGAAAAPGAVASASVSMSEVAPAGAAPTEAKTTLTPSTTAAPAMKGAAKQPAKMGAPTDVPAAPARAAAQAGSAGAMELQIETTGTTWVQLFCDDREAINWVMKEGESEAMRCLRLIRVSAADAAAVRLTVNGAACVPLGDSGSRVHGFTIRSDDFRQICAGDEGRGEHGRH